MLIETKTMGKVEVSDEQMIQLPSGLFGFADYHRFALIDCHVKPLIWMQSLEDKDVAITVASPLALTDTYSPAIEEKDLEGIGELKEDNIIVLVTVNIPDKIEDMSANLKSPIIINTDTNKGVQVIAANEELSAKQPVYEYLKAKKA